MRMHSRIMVVLGLAGLVGALCVTAPASSEAGTIVYPNIIEAIPTHLQIQNDHQREWLRFSTTHINIGEGNLQIRGGGQIAPCDIDGIHYDQCTIATQELLDAAGNVVATHPAGVAFFHPEHNHWHQSAVAAFMLKTGDPFTGLPVATGVKITFCFVDVKTYSSTGRQKKAYPRTYFDCNGEFQGLAAHWADEYHQSTPLQELEVTGLPEGEYYLTHEADPENHWIEDPNGGEQDNFTWVKFYLSRGGANPKITILEHSPCVVPAQCGFGGNP